MFFKYSWSNTLARIFNYYLCSLSFKISDRVYFVHPSIDMSTYQPTYQPRYQLSYGRHINQLLADILEVKSLDCQCHDQIYIKVIRIASFGQPQKFLTASCLDHVHKFSCYQARHCQIQKKQKKGGKRKGKRIRTMKDNKMPGYNWVQLTFDSVFCDWILRV